MMRNYCRHHFAAFLSPAQRSRSSVQPLWKMLNYSQSKVNYFPKGAFFFQRTVWQLEGDGSQMHNYWEFLRACRDLWPAGCIPSWGTWGKKWRTHISGLSLGCYIYVEITFGAGAFLASCQLWRQRRDIQAEFFFVARKLVCSRRPTQFAVFTDVGPK